MKSNPFAMSYIVANDPIQLGDGDSCEGITEQLSRQLRTFEMEFSDPGLFQENMSKEFGKIMEVYNENHDILTEFKSKFEGKQKTLTQNLEEI